MAAPAIMRPVTHETAKVFKDPIIPFFSVCAFQNMAPRRPGVAPQWPLAWVQLSNVFR